MTTKPSTLYLVDGTSQLFRAYYALPRMTNASGLPTNAVFGFTTMLRKLIKDHRPTSLAVVFDVPGKVFRNEAFSDYKANRSPTPEDLREQIPHAKRVCEAMNVPVMQLEGFEADDLIATYTQRAREAGFEVVVVGSDKDLLQLVGEGVAVFNPTREVMMDAAAVAESFGVGPDRVLEVQGLAGDSVDNIPGVPGVGEKTAIALINAYQKIEVVIERAGRFVAAFDARDGWLELLSRAEGEETLQAATVDALESAGQVVARSLGALAECERDSDTRERWNEGAAAAKDAAAIAEVRGAVGRPGRPAIRPLKPLRKTLKALDRGSGRRAWYAIAEHAEQALLSRQLATLHRAVPVEAPLESLRWAGPDARRMLELFRELGFRSLIAELESESTTAVSAAATPDAVPRPTLVVDAGTLARLADVCAESDPLAVVVHAEGSDALRADVIGVSLANVDATFYVPLRHTYLGAPESLAPARLAETLGPVLRRRDAGIVTHDAIRTGHLLRRSDMPISTWRLDTMVAAFLLDADRASYPLERLADDYLGRSVAGRELLTGSGARRTPLGQVEVERLADYGSARAHAAACLAPDLEQRLADDGLDTLYRTIDGPLLPLLERMEQIGIKIDTALLETMSGEMAAELERLRIEIQRLAGCEFNPDSPKQLREVLFERLGLKSRRKTAKSRVASTDAQTLEELADQHEIARRLLDYRELAKLTGTYVDALPRLVHPETGRVHTSYHPTGAATGRLSSSDPNLQNIPVRSEAGRRIRGAFVAQPGWTFLTADYSQIELRVLAHLCGDPGLAEAFRAGDDIHRFTAARVFGVMRELVSDDQRRRAKAVNFGILYGMSETRLAREQGMTRGEARKFIEAYFERFSSVRSYIDGVRQQALEQGEVRTMFGRVRRFPQLHRRVHRGIQEQALRAAVNATIQGTAADLMKLAMLAVDRELRAAGLGARVLLQVHDELLLEVPRDEIERTAAQVCEAMETVHPLDVPLKVDSKVGLNWLDAE